MTCNGSTRVFEALGPGSNPGRTTNLKKEVKKYSEIVKHNFFNSKIMCIFAMRLTHKHIR